MLRPSRAAFAFIFITVSFDMLALGIIVPVLPKRIIAFEDGDVAHAARILGHRAAAGRARHSRRASRPHLDCSKKDSFFDEDGTANGLTRMTRM
jgi:hypothetical protein